MTILRVLGSKGEDKGTIETGDLICTQTNESIFGYEVGREEFMGRTIIKQSLPVLGDDFKPTGERYDMYEYGNYNQVWVFKTIEEARDFIQREYS